jgi:hypothetical protein
MSEISLYHTQTFDTHEDDDSHQKFRTASNSKKAADSNAVPASN